MTTESDKMEILNRRTEQRDLAIKAHRLLDQTLTNYRRDAANGAQLAEAIRESRDMIRKAMEQ